MPKKKTTEQFLKEAKEKHGDRYDYSLVQYKDTNTEVEIICKKHGVFHQSPKCHLKYSGCRVCSIEHSNIQKMRVDKNTSYMIGLFQTDGHMSCSERNRGKLSMELSIRDEDIIYKLADLIPHHVGIRKRMRHNTVNNHNYYGEFIGLSVSNKNFRRFFFESGIPYGKKSKILKPPLHLTNLSIADYVRGLYDGDGSLGLTNKGLPYMSFATDSDEMAKFLTDYISEITKKPLKNTKRNNRDNIYNIMITKEDAVIFSNEIYYEGCLSMIRKYNKSLEVKKWIRPSDMRFGAETKRWTKDQDEYIQNHSVEESMEYLDRTEKSVKVRLQRLK
jgi:hypothetical protein